MVSDGKLRVCGLLYVLCVIKAAMHAWPAECTSASSYSLLLLLYVLDCSQVRAGLPEGTQFVFDNEGDLGPKHKAGPVAYVLKAQPHSRFTCSGSDLMYTAQIPLVHSLCGTSLPVETLDGR